MIGEKLNITILGLSISSSWGNGHATTYRSLVKALHALGHQVIFLERDVPWYANHRDMPDPPFCEFHLYQDLNDLKNNFLLEIKEADLVIVGSYVPEGVAVGQWIINAAQGIKTFYDIDTPVTLSKLERNDFEYVSPDQIPNYDIYLSFTGGPVLKTLEYQYGSPMAKALYCSVDPEKYFPQPTTIKWDLGYLGTYSKDRQPPLEKLLFDAAKKYKEGKFIVAGPQYPAAICWPENIAHEEHLPPSRHLKFYNAQRFTLNITRADMIKAGFAPSVRLFEAAACGTPVISDYWEGLGTFFEPDLEILISRSAEETIHYLHELNEPDRVAIGNRARLKVLDAHTSAHRAAELIHYYHESMGEKSVGHGK